MASLCFIGFPKPSPVSKLQKIFWPRRRRVFLRDIRDLPREIHSIHPKNSTSNFQPSMSTRPLGEFFLLGSYLPNTSPSHQLAGPGWAHGPFLKMIRIASPFKKKHRPRKKVQQKDLLTSPSPRTTVVHGCHVSLPSANDEKRRQLCNSASPLSLLGFIFNVGLRRWDNVPQMFRRGCCNPLN